MLRSKEFAGLSDDDKLPELDGKGMVLPAKGVSRLGEEDSMVVGIVGGSTRRIFLGGGLKKSKQN